MKVVPELLWVKSPAAWSVSNKGQVSQLGAFSFRDKGTASQRVSELEQGYLQTLLETGVL